MKSTPGEGGASQDCVVGGQGIPIAWRKRCTSYALYEGGSRTMTRDQISRALEAAFAAWTSVTCGANRSIGLQATQLPEPSMCDQAEYNVNGPNQNTVVFVQDWDDRCVILGDGTTICYDPKAFAVTTVWHNKNSGEIFDVDIEVNENRGPYGVCPTEPGRCTDRVTVDLQNVLTHEVGHYFGLGHPPTTQTGADKTTMYADSQPGETSKRSLDTDDINGICAIYSEGTLPTTCNDSPPGGLSLECYQPSSGCAISPAGLVTTGSSSARAEWAWYASALGLAVLIAIRRRPKRL